MDVTSHNFHRAFKLLRRLLPGASYVSIDFEFTGLGSNRTSNLDTPQQRYEVARQDARDYPPIQFGLTVFHRRDSPPYLFAIPFNFNIFPHAVYFPPNQNYPLIDNTIKFQSSTVRFLTHHGFDFQRLFEQGIPWMRFTDETYFRGIVTDNITARRNPKLSIKPGDVSAEQSFEIDKFRSRIDNWISQYPVTDSPDFFPKTKTFHIPSRSLLRRLIFDMIRRNFPCLSAKIISTPEGSRLQVSLHRNEEIAEQERAHEIRQEINHVIDQEVGVRPVFDLLREERVPIVVHHGFMDIVKLYANFVSDLPPLLPDFKKLLHKTFPRIYDTRSAMDFICRLYPDIAKSLATTGRHYCGLSDYIDVMRKFATAHSNSISTTDSISPSTLIPTQNMRLHDPACSNIFADDSGYLFVKESDVGWDMSVDEYGFGRYMYPDTNFHHEAGFDAFEAGRLFALIENILGSDDSMGDVKNKIFLSACGGYRFIDLQGHDINEWFNQNVIIVTRGQPQNGPEHWCVSALRKLTQGTKFEGEVSDFVMIDRTSFLGILVKGSGTEQQFDIPEIEKVVANGERVNLKVQRYTEAALVDSDVTTTGSDHKKRRVK